MTINDKGAGDPTLDDEMREWLRRLAAALIDDPDELQRRYDEIDAIIAKLDSPAPGQEVNE